MLGWLHRSLPTWQGRILTGLALTAAIVTGLLPDHPRPADAGKIIAIAVAAIGWVFAELSGTGGPRAHDVDLFHRFAEALGSRERSLLRDQDFLASFATKDLDGLREIATWSDVTHEFVDVSVQKRWAPLQAEVAAFVELIALKTGPVGANVAMLTVHPDNANHDHPAEWVGANGRELNAAAVSLHGDLQAFERYARRRLGR